jgi:hypothetical protein
MPKRLFKYQSTKELLALTKELSTALTSGVTTALRQSSTGFLAESGPISQRELEERLMNVRYEIYLRGQGFPNQGIPADEACAEYEPTNPYAERVMRVEVFRGGTYGQPYSVPPTFP